MQLILSYTDIRYLRNHDQLSSVVKIYKIYNMYGA